MVQPRFLQLSLSSPRRSHGTPATVASPSSLRFWTVALVLSMVALLAAGEKHASYLERMSHGDYDLRGVETCSAASTSTSSPDEMAGTIKTNAQRCLEYIDDMKEEYTQHLLSVSWSRANEREPPKLCEDVGVSCAEASEVYTHETYLPVVPVGVPAQPADFDTTLLKAYSLLQHYEVALQHLLLDQNEISEQNVKYRDYINTVKMEVSNLQCLLLRDMTRQGLTANIEVTKKLTEEVFRRQWIPKQWKKRDFVFLRDTRAGIQYIKDAFSTFL